MEREAKENKHGGCCKADGEDDGYDEYEEEQTYVIKRLVLAPKREDET